MAIVIAVIGVTIQILANSILDSEVCGCGDVKIEIIKTREQSQAEEREGVGNATEMPHSGHVVKSVFTARNRACMLHELNFLTLEALRRVALTQPRIENGESHPQKRFSAGQARVSIICILLKSNVTPDGTTNNDTGGRTVQIKKSMEEKCPFTGLDELRNHQCPCGWRGNITSIGVERGAVRWEYVGELDGGVSEC
nr:hypothetical protein Iba_chr14aCG15880 [Ipomoea batatas]